MGAPGRPYSDTGRFLGASFMAAEIVILGLGPGRWEDVTLEAQTALEQAASGGQVVYFRTLRHPTVDAIRARYPALVAQSFDALYEQSENWNSLYAAMARHLCAAAAGQEGGDRKSVV